MIERNGWYASACPECELEVSSPGPETGDQPRLISVVGNRTTVTDLPSHGRFPRVKHGYVHQFLIVGQDGLARIVRDDGPVTDLGGAYAPMADWDGVFAAWQNSGSTYSSADNAWPIPVGASTQGFTGDPSEQKSWPEYWSAHPFVVHGVTIFNPCQSSDGEWTIGNHPSQPMLLAYQRSTDTLYNAGPTFNSPINPRLVMRGDEPIICRSYPSGLLTRDGFVEIPYVTEPEHVCIPGIGKRQWIVPFFERGLRYGDSPALMGNAVMCCDPGDALHNAATTTFPLFSTPEAYDQSVVGNIVAYWTTGGSMDELKAHYNKALALPEKPIVAYLDGRDWPMNRPSWFKANRTWIGVQCYREPNEPIDDFETAMVRLLDRLEAWGLPLMLTGQWYDRNGTQSVPYVLEVLPCYENWLRDFNTVGLMPFSDRRKGGYLDHPEFRPWGEGYTTAIIGRPGRYDYWLPDTTPMADVLRNALSQDVEYVWMDKARRDYLLALLPPKGQQ
jgi:hypothetical protein